jgi:Protein of unknown function (DUF1566)
LASTSDAAAGRHRAWWPGVGRAALCLAVLAGMAPWQGAGAQQACSGERSSLSATRFTDNGDGTVTDAESKLMWMRCAGGQQWRGQRCAGAALAYDWTTAGQQAEMLNREGSAFFNDWRLPSLRELATITDRGCRNPRTNLAVFPGTPAAAFWSSTLRPGETAGERVLGLSFGDEGVILARKDERFHLRLVRTGP